MLSVRRPFALLLAVPAALVGCTATPAPSAEPSSPPAITANPTPVSTEPTSGSTTDASAPAAACLSGDYQATSVTSGKTKVGVRDVEAKFRGGNYTFEFDEDDAITVTLGKQTGKVRVDGDLRGTYAGDADALTFKLGRTTGTARFTRNGKTTTVPMKQVADVFAPQGKGSATCSGDNLIVTTSSVTWRFVRDTDD